MNTITQTNVYYISPSRTIETILIENLYKTIYVYNYEGNHFRLFTELIELVNFFQFGKESKLDFLNELDLDDYILNYL